MKNDGRNKTLGYFALLYGIILFFLLFENLFWYIHNPDYPGWGFIYMFTNQANLIMMSWLLLFGFSHFLGRPSRLMSFSSHPLVVSAVTLYISIVFLVVLFILFPFYKAKFADHLINDGVMLFTHFLSIAVAFTFFFFIRTGSVKRTWLSAVFLLIYPLSFLILNFIIGFTVGKFAYDFINPTAYSHIGLYVFAMVSLAAAFWFLGFLILLLQRHINKQLAKK